MPLAPYGMMSKAQLLLFQLTSILFLLVLHSINKFRKKIIRLFQVYVIRASNCSTQEDDVVVEEEVNCNAENT